MNIPNKVFFTAYHCKMASILQLLKLFSICTTLCIYLLITSITLTFATENNGTETCMNMNCHTPGGHATLKPEDLDCINCHQPTSQHALSSTGEGVKTVAACRECHLFSGKYQHPPAAAQDCPACHDFHKSAPNYPLRKKDETLCQDCHLSFIKTDNILHQATGGEKPLSCIGCHSPHSSSQPGLLNYSYDRAPYYTYTKSTYPLCFSCHPRNMLQFPDTMHYTEFRDGKKNLHYLHVNKKKRGINCRLCHAVHQATNSKLIATRVSYGEWFMPINFKKSENGGSCSPGCHNPVTYDRSLNEHKTH